MKFSDSFDVDAPINKVYFTLTNPDAISKSLPDLQSMEVVDKDKFKAKFKVGMSYIRGSVNLEFEFKNKIENKHATVLGHGSGMQSSIDLVIDFDLMENNGLTKVDWSADAKVGGLIAGVGSKLLEGSTKKQIDKLVNSLKELIEQS